MFKNILATALVAGAFVGIVLTALQLAITSPIIMQAEAYESGELVANSSHEHTNPAAEDGDSASGHDHSGAWSPSDGLERHALTGLSTILTSIGFGLVLIALMVIKGGRVDGQRGLLWGLGGFAAITLAPALGLAPELPGSAAADIDARQMWWYGTALATAGGLWLMVFSGHLGIRLGGVLLLVLPHLVGAPMPDQFTSDAPAELAGEFASASIVLGAVFWALLGWASGMIWDRLNGGEAAAA